MSYKPDNGGNLFRPKSKVDGDNMPAYSGNVNFKDVDFELSVWPKKDKNGNTFLSTSTKPVWVPPDQAEGNSASVDDDIPF